MTTTADQTRTALVEALLRLVRDHSLAEISVRDIAKEAGVNHGLVHRHFGSRDNLLREATTRVTAEIHGEPGTRGVSSKTFGYLRDHPELVRVLAQLCLERRTDLLEAAAPTPEHLDAIVGRLRRGLDAANVNADPRVLNAFGISAILGWILFKPLLEAGYQLPEDADDQLADMLALVDMMAGGATP